MYKSAVFAALLVTGLLSTAAQADVKIGDVTFTTPVSVSGPNAYQRAKAYAERRGGRLPTVTEFRMFSSKLRKYRNFNKPFHVYFTSKPGWQYHVSKNAAHRDGGSYFGFDLVTVIIENPNHESPWNPGGF